MRIRVDTLADYPFVIVRARCSQCRRDYSFRLARLGEAYGANITMDDLLDRVFRDCPWRLPDGRTRPRKYEARCLAFLPDLHPMPRPPDLPPGLLKLTLMRGWKS